MASSFEPLESRSFLTNLLLEIDGPRIVEIGEEVSYTFTVGSREQNSVRTAPLSWVPLDTTEWSIDGESWVAEENQPTELMPIQLEPDETFSFVVKGVVPEAPEYFIVSLSTPFSDGSIGQKTLSIYVLDYFSDDYTIGSTIRTEGGIPSESDPDLPSPSIDFGDGTHGYEIGDIDRDGYEDLLRTDPSGAANAGTATILFGPDHRENFVVFGSLFVGQPGGDPLFGRSAGSLDDLNGDGFGDFFVVDRYDRTVFRGRDFERNPTGDVNRDGTVDFNDFLILADNFGRETNDRALGELDGDGRVTFLDFLLLAENFGKST